MEPPKEPPPPDSIEKAAKAIGVSPKFVRKLMREGKVECYKLHRRDHRVDVADVIQWAMSTKTSGPSMETKNEPIAPAQTSGTLRHVKPKRSK